jgi:predicted ester cyclase
MSQEQNREIVQAAFAPLDTILQTHERIYRPDWVGHFPGMPALDADGHRQYSEVMMTAFPDLERWIEDMFAEGDKVVARWSATGTHSGSFQGIPPSGKVAKSSGITIFRIASS